MIPMVLKGYSPVLGALLTAGVTTVFNIILVSGANRKAWSAIMDVGMSIASSIFEVHTASPKLSLLELYKSGMNVGRDVLGIEILQGIAGSIGLILTVPITVWITASLAKKERKS